MEEKCKNEITGQKNCRRKQNAGITLIALVVTIIVLIILATVTINMVLGDNGLIKQAENTKILTEVGTLREGISMKNMERKTEKGYNINRLVGSIEEVLGDSYKEYNERYAIEGGKLVYKENKFSEEDIKLLEESGVEKESKHYLIMNESTKTSKYADNKNAITLWELQDKINSTTKGEKFSGTEGEYNKAYIIEDLDLGARWNEEGKLLNGDKWIAITQIPANTVLDGCDFSIQGLYTDSEKRSSSISG